jgi:BirA family biotin operon repressor/biotin-[acetyl-CoA-carboxylase] ligase
MWNIQTFTEIPSTQKLAREKLQAGEASNGDVFATLHQTEGTGRYPDRPWLDEFGANLLMSVVLTDIPNHLHNKMQFIAALSILTTLRTQLSIRGKRQGVEFDTSRVRLKWTNDILIDNKKVSGIVADAIWSGETLKGIVLGIGININQENFPEEIAGHATSLKLITDIDFPVDRTRALVLSMLQFSLEYYTAESLITRLSEELRWMKNINSFSLTEPDGTKSEGLRYEGITNDGALVAISPDEEKRIFQNGSLHFA